MQIFLLAPALTPSAMHPVLFASLVGIQQIVCWGTLTYATAVFAPAMAQACSISIASVMTAYGLGLLTNAFAAPALTRWVLRIGAFVPALAGLALLVLACLLLSQASHALMLVAGFMIAGVAMALTQYDFAFLTVQLHQPQQARRVITLITFYGALASSIMWPSALALSSWLGMPGAWAALGLISVLGSLPAVFGLPAAARNTCRTADDQQPRRSSHTAQRLIKLGARWPDWLFVDRCQLGGQFAIGAFTDADTQPRYRLDSVALWHRPTGRARAGLRGSQVAVNSRYRHGKQFKHRAGHGFDGVERK
jgi:predicted MFS family arabinose efflux permease